MAVFVFDQPPIDIRSCTLVPLEASEEAAQKRIL